MKIWSVCLAGLALAGKKKNKKKEPKNDFDIFEMFYPMGELRTGI